MRTMRCVFSFFLALICWTSAAAQTGLPLTRTSKAQPSKQTPNQELRIFADGNLRKAVSESIRQPTGGGEEEGTDGVARLGLSLIDRDRGTTWSGVVSVASTVTRVSENYVATVLTPGSGKGFHSGLLEHRRHHEFEGKWAKLHNALLSDLHFYGTVAASEWDSSGVGFKAVTFGAAILRVFTPIQGSMGGTDVGLSVELGPCFRSIGGDVTLSRHARFLGDAVGTEGQNFFGGEVGMQIHVGDITTGIQLYKFGTGSTEVPGLSRTQVIASVNVRGPLFSESKD